MSQQGKQPGARKRKRGIVLDFDYIVRLLDERNLTFEDAIANELANISSSTWREIRSGKPKDRATAGRIAEFFGVSINDLRQKRPAPLADGRWQISQLPSWEFVEALDREWQKTSNGLTYIRCKVRDRYASNQSNPCFGRARIFNLKLVADAASETMRERLRRHAQLCRRLAHHPCFVDNHVIAPVENETIWWVVDEWVDSTTLAELIATGPLPLSRLVHLMNQIAEALVHLHGTEQVVLRELAPCRVLVTPHDEIRLTELDLAKLLDGSTTVSSTWPEDRYRAPEADQHATFQADLFSWGMIFLHALTGNRALKRTGLSKIESSEFSGELRDLVTSCLASTSRKRPARAEELTRACHAWLECNSSTSPNG